MEPDPLFNCACDAPAMWYIASEAGKSYAACDLHTLNALEHVVTDDRQIATIRRVGSNRIWPS